METATKVLLSERKEHPRGRKMPPSGKKEHPNPRQKEGKRDHVRVVLVEKSSEMDSRPVFTSLFDHIIVFVPASKL